jgi:putative hydrolase of the HAD superfamily
MILNLTPETVVIFDLDDTLYSEVDYLRSAYRFISRHLHADINKDIYEEMIGLYENKEAVFDIIKTRYSISTSIDEMVSLYRFHLPSIELREGALHLLEILKSLNIKTALLTDGRGITQRNKLKALKIEHFFDPIVISEEFGSEKPDSRNYLYFEEKFPRHSFVYIGDNIKKDFKVPNELKWQTIGIKDQGQHIHTQDHILPDEYYPGNMINSFMEIEILSGSGSRSTERL